MKRLFGLPTLFLLAGCTVETATFYAPIIVQPETRAAQYVVIIDNNPPYRCLVVPTHQVYPAIYTEIYGPTALADAQRYNRMFCRGRRR